MERTVTTAVVERDPFLLGLDIVAEVQRRALDAGQLAELLGKDRWHLRKLLGHLTVGRLP